MNVSLCPCGSSKPRPRCCGPFLDGNDVPRRADELMRSRYAAYVEGHIDYIEKTCIGPALESFDRSSAEQFSAEARWQGLTIHSRERGAAEDDEGTVTFEVRFEVKGHREGFREKSSFRRIDGRWFYRSGEVTPLSPSTTKPQKVGRNSPCPCGSGKKYKRCCGR